MNSTIVLTVIGKDHPGIVSSLSDILKRHDGNWTQSSMSTLAGQFVGILMAIVPSARVEACIMELEALTASGIEVVAHVSDTESETSAHAVYTLDLVGHDRPGIVQEITRVLAQHGINVNELETEVASASMAGGPLFKARARLAIPAEVNISDLEAQLESIANELMVEFRPER